MGRNHRPQRMGEEIKKIVGDLLLKGRLKDPRFKGMIAVSGVDVSGDGSYATLYITAMSFNPAEGYSDEDKQGILDAFAHSQGFIRSELGKNMKVRHVPELIFKFDGSFEYGQKMDALLDSLNIPKDEPVTEEDEEEDEYR